MSSGSASCRSVASPSDRRASIVRRPGSPRHLKIALSGSSDLSIYLTVEQASTRVNGGSTHGRSSELLQEYEQRGAGGDRRGGGRQRDKCDAAQASRRSGALKEGPTGLDTQVLLHALFRPGPIETAKQR